MKKTLCYVLVLSMLLSALLSLFAFADDDTVTVDGMTFQKYWNGDACSLIDIDENVSGHIIIPNTVRFGSDDLPVKEIWCDAFRQNEKITGITFPDGDVNFYSEIVESYSSFSSCSALKRIIMGKGNYVREWLFSKCKSLEEVIIPEGVEAVYLSAFYECDNLKSVTLPSSVLEIYNGFTEGYKYTYILQNKISTVISINNSNDNFTDVNGIIFSKDMTELVYYPNYAPADYTVPLSVKKICSNAFSGCNNLKNLEIGENVETIEYAFGGCDNLVSINVDKNNKNFTSVDGVLFSKDMTRLIQYPFAKLEFYYEVPDTVTTIDCFSRRNMNTSWLKGISLPENTGCLIRGGNLISLEFNSYNPNDLYYNYWTCYNAKNIIVNTDNIDFYGGELGPIFTDIETVFYHGNEEQWETFINKFDSYDEVLGYLSKANVVYNYKLIRGDCTGDGEIDNKDVVTAFRFCSGTDVNAIIKAMNVNGDSYVDNKDVVTLFRYISAL